MVIGNPGEEVEVHAEENFLRGNVTKEGICWVECMEERHLGGHYD